MGVPASQAVQLPSQRVIPASRIPAFPRPTVDAAKPRLHSTQSNTTTTTLSVLMAAKPRYVLSNHESDKQHALRTRLTTHLREDQQAALRPNMKDPFNSLDDAVDRLLPYHIFQYPDAEFSDGSACANAVFDEIRAELESRHKKIQAKLLEMRRRESRRQELQLFSERMLTNDMKTDLIELRRSYGHLLHTQQRPPLMNGPLNMMAIRSVEAVPPGMMVGPPSTFMLAPKQNLNRSDAVEPSSTSEEEDVESESEDSEAEQ